MTSKAGAKKVQANASLHWFTFYVNHHGRLPTDTNDRPKRIALRDIVCTQCHGDEIRALSLIEQIVTAPIYGDDLATRYVVFWAWIDQGMPNWARTHKVPKSLVHDVCRCLLANAGRRAA